MTITTVLLAIGLALVLLINSKLTDIYLALTRLCNTMDKIHQANRRMF